MPEATAFRSGCGAAKARRGTALLLLRLLLGLVIGATLLLFVFGLFDPALPLASLDDSYVAVAGEASAKAVRWGVDLAFTSGPAEPITSSYYNSQYFSHTVPILLGLSLVEGLGIACLLLEPVRSGRQAVPAGLAVAIVILIVLCGHFGRDFVFFDLSLLVFLLGLMRGDRLTGLAFRAGSLLLGVAGVSKTSYLVLSLALLGLLDARALLGRRAPLCLPVFGLGFLATDLWYGQRLADLPIYVLRQFSVASGFAAAMGHPAEDGRLALFLLLALAIVLAPLWTGRPCDAGGPDRTDRRLLSLGLLIYSVILLKAGFVRDDDGHVTIAFSSLSIGLVLVSARLATYTGRWAPLAGLVAVPVGFALVSLLVPVEPGGPRDVGTLIAYLKTEIRPALRNAIAVSTAALGDLGGLKARFDRAKAAAWRQIAADRPFSALAGTVDVIPSEQSAILANGLDYHPRPSFQEYATYTATLIAANQAFFEAPTGPDWIIFAPGSIDNRYPASAEGASWPDFLRLYAPAQSLADSLVLRRRAQPLPKLLGAPLTQRARIGEWLPITQPAPLFAKIHVHTNLLFRLDDLLFRPPILTLAVRLRNGEEKRFRYVPAQGEAGFVLSPFIARAADYAALATGKAGRLTDQDVIGVAILGSASSRHFFSSEIEIETQEIDPAPLAAAPDG